MKSMSEKEHVAKTKEELKGEIRQIKRQVAELHTHIDDLLREP